MFRSVKSSKYLKIFKKSKFNAEIKFLLPAKILRVDNVSGFSHRSEKEALREKMQNLQNKILVGGENLLEKAEAQEHLLAAAAVELDQRKSREEQLKRAIEEKEAERIDIEEKYSSLQEEAAGKTKKLARVHTMLMSAKAELLDLQEEHQREMEGLLEGVRGIGRELQLQELILNSYIPVQYQVRQTRIAAS